MGRTGYRTYFDGDADNTAKAVKTSAGRIHMIEVSQINNTDSFLQIFDLAAADVTVGTTTPEQSYAIPLGDGTNIGGFDMNFGEAGMDFQAAITVAVTTTATGSGDPTTGAVLNIAFD